MGDKTKIEWTDASWTPIRARNKATGKVGWHCEKVSAGCDNCYSATFNQDRFGTGLPFKPGHRKDIEIFLDEEMLLQPLRWKKPRKIFVCSMTDLFGDFHNDEWIDKVFAVMALSPQHTFQCLTKRSRRMRDYCSAPHVTHRIAKAIDAIHVDMDHQSDELWLPVPDYEQYEASTHGRVRRDGLILKEQVNERFDRASITLWQGNESKTVWVHTLVLSAHRGARPDEYEACYHNGNSRDNRLANLYWGTREQNQREKVRHGANGGPAKISREQSVEIRAACASGETQQSIADRYGISRSLVSMIKDRKVWPDALTWPLPNVHLGVSCEDQTRADERIPDLLATPAAARFVSAEPLLGPIDFRKWTPSCYECGESCGERLPSPPQVERCFECGEECDQDTEPVFSEGCPKCGGELQWVCPSCNGTMVYQHPDTPILDQIIVGGESGPSHRPMQIEWAEDIMRQCREAGTAFFFKQDSGLRSGMRGRASDELWACKQMVGDVK